MRCRLTLPSLCLAALLITSASAAAAPSDPLSHEGRWVTDAHGRVVVLHGVNMVYKVGDYRPASSGFSADDARFLQRKGFNTVRLGIIYKGLEPKPPKDGKPRYSRGYLRSVQRTQRMLARHGIFTLLDFHQDLYNERFQGEGWPDWAVADDGVPAEPQQGFPLNYLVNAGLNRAFDNFWGDKQVEGRPLQSAYAAAWRRVARRFRDAPRLLGYDLLNEPWPGSQFPSCVSPAGCPVFDTGPLAEFTKRVIDRIRAVDRSSLVFYEPLLTFDFGAQTALDPGDPNAVLGFHDYCLPAGVGSLPGSDLTCAQTEALVFDNAEARSQATGDGQLLTEFSATNDVAENTRMLDLADRNMVGWQIWHYCGCDDPTTSGPGVQSIVGDANKPPKGKNVNHKKLRLISRPYPRAVAGTPKGWSFNAKHRRFKLRYSTSSPAAGKLPRARLTEVFMPSLQYPHGYRVSKLRGGRVVSPPNARVLKLMRGRRAKTVKLATLPRAASAQSAAGD